MKTLNTLLERFKKSLGKDVLAKEEILKCVESCTNIILTPKEVSLKNGVLEINTSPTKNNEIRLKEEKILHFLNNSRGISVNKIFYK